MLLIGLCIQVCERRRCWLRIFPLPSGLKVETLLLLAWAHSRTNSRLVATWQLSPPLLQSGFTRLVALCSKVTTRRSRVQPSLLSCPCAFHYQHPEHTPNHTPAAAWHHRTHSQGVWRRAWPAARRQSRWQPTLAGLSWNTRLGSAMKIVRQPQDFICPVRHN